MPPFIYIYICTLGQDGIVGHDIANAVAMAEDGSVVIAGHSRGHFLDRSTVEADNSSTLFPHWLGGDFAAIKLDSGGAELWRWQVRRHGTGVVNTLP